jgi:hypothetical protein
MFVGIKENEIWRKRYSKELMQLFGDLGILSFVRIIRIGIRLVILTERIVQEK